VAGLEFGGVWWTVRWHASDPYVLLMLQLTWVDVIYLFGRELRACGEVSDMLTLLEKISYSSIDELDTNRE
jgi:hypothetical protein